MKHDSNSTNPSVAENDCEQARALASAWIDGELAHAEPLHAHVASCAPCRAHVARLRETQTLFAPLRADGPDVDLWPQIAARTRALRAPAASAWKPRVARIAAAFVGFVGAGLLLRASSSRTVDSDVSHDQLTTSWAAPLHLERSGLGRLQAAPERQLLTALGLVPEERR